MYEVVVIDFNGKESITKISTECISEKGVLKPFENKLMSSVYGSRLRVVVKHVGIKKCENDETIMKMNQSSEVV